MTPTSSMQNLILQGLQQKLQKSCSRCNKNTRHVESSYILQPPKYLLLFVNQFRYINNYITKDRCPIPMDTTVRLGPLKLGLQATIDHHGPSIDSGHYTASINCCKKTFYCNDHKITEFGITDKNSSTAYIILYKWIFTWFLDSNRRVGVWSLPWRWHILSIPLTIGRGTSAETCGWTMCFLLMSLVPVQKLCVYIYVYVFIQYFARNRPWYSLRGLHIRITWFSLYGIRIPLFSLYGIHMPLLPYMVIQPVVLGMALLRAAMDASLSQGPLLWRHNDMTVSISRDTRGRERDTQHRLDNTNARRLHR